MNGFLQLAIGKLLKSLLLLWLTFPAELYDESSLLSGPELVILVQLPNDRVRKTIIKPLVNTLSV